MTLIEIDSLTFGGLLAFVGKAVIGLTPAGVLVDVGGMCDTFDETPRFTMFLTPTGIGGGGTYGVVVYL